MSDRDFEKKLTERLRASSEDLDAATRSRLNRARQRALDEMPRSRGSRIPGGRWLPAGALAATAFLAIVLWQGNLPRPGAVEFPREIASVDDSADSVSLEMELLLNQSDLEMFEDLEFYAALSEAELGTAG